MGGCGHTGHAADELAKGIEDVRIADRSVAGIGLPPAVPSDERCSRRGKTCALPEAEQQVVIRNIEEEIAGGLILAFKAAVEQLDTGIVEPLQFPRSIGRMGWWMTTQKTGHATSASSHLRKFTPVKLSRH